MKQNQNGFTLIELVMVIVILGVLAAVALPKFVDLKGDAQLASVQGVAGALSSASAINYGACMIANNTAGAKCVTVNKCSQAGALLQPALTLAATATKTAPYLSADTSSTTTNGGTASCTLNFSTDGTASAGSATYVVTSAGN